MEKIDSFEVVTLHESGMRFVHDIEIVMKDGKAEVTQYGFRFEPNGDRRVPEIRAVCGEEIILRLLNACGLLSWNGFHGPHPKDVLDGIMFSLDAKVNGGVEVSAEGSQNFPKGYHEFRSELYEILRTGETLD